MSTHAQENVNLFIPLILVIFVGSIVTIGVYLASNSQRETSDTRYIQQEVPELDSREISQRIDKCTQESSIQQKDWCYLEIAKNYERNVCDRISQDNFNLYCRAIIRSSPGLCKSIGVDPMRDACYISLAQKMQDKSLCDETQRESFCKALFE